MVCVVFVEETGVPGEFSSFERGGSVCVWWESVVYSILSCLDGELDIGQTCMHRFLFTEYRSTYLPTHGIKLRRHPSVCRSFKSLRFCHFPIFLCFLIVCIVLFSFLPP